MTFIFCRRPGDSCHAEGTTRHGMCWRHWAWGAVGKDCAWCGGEIGVDGARPFANRCEEVFCSAAHRTASNRALARLHERVADAAAKVGA